MYRGACEACLYVGPRDRATLERLVADGKTPQKIVKRAKIVVLSERGMGTNAITREARVSKPTVWPWQEVYLEGGVARLLKDKGPRAGKKRISEAVRLEIVTRAAKDKPANARACWPQSSMSGSRRCSGRGRRMVSTRMTRSFKLSNDPEFAEKVVDIVGLYLDPPAACR